MWKAGNFHISINRHELLHRNCTHYINNDLPWTSSRGLIWSTSKSLGFFPLITADQALSRFSFFKSAFNVSSMLDVSPIEGCILPRWGGTAVSHHIIWCGPMEDVKMLLCTHGGFPGSGAMRSNISSCSCQWSLGPSGYNRVPWSTWGEQEPLGLYVTHLHPGESTGLHLRAQFTTNGQSTEERLKQFRVCSQLFKIF